MAPLHPLPDLTHIALGGGYAAPVGAAGGGLGSAIANSAALKLAAVLAAAATMSAGAGNVHRVAHRPATPAAAAAPATAHTARPAGTRTGTAAVASIVPAHSATGAERDPPRLGAGVSPSPVAAAPAPPTPSPSPSPSGTPAGRRGLHTAARRVPLADPDAHSERKRLFGPVAHAQRGAVGRRHAGAVTLARRLALPHTLRAGAAPAAAALEVRRRVAT